ncbi:hypothetical protein FEM48_Zijuj12G0126500 [Ziziphus jujuba var. spinosa]|uniref:Uncharacterized protein n=1 Tax=Ziziphus jujuba var. spinosa TaxID=714518 RepID=A0A978UDD7_ZIZJJ|nr:hypothetical protein FEM48_Zijuj12G0126500 [Ziziphus jujuba var. spinosa]
MLWKAIRLEALTFSSILSVSAGLATLNQGVQILALVLKMGIEPGPSRYACMVDLLGQAGLLDERKRKERDNARMTKKSKVLRKSPGCSWIIVNDKVHLFFAGDQSQVDLEEIKTEILR